MRKQKVAMLSVYSNSFLVALKFIVGISMGSVSVISEGVHSMIDLVAAIIANYSVRRSGEPADLEHPYGHGKFENYAGVIEAILIFFAATIIVYESITKILEGAVVELLYAGIIIMGISAIINFLVSRTLYRVGIEEDSMALQADGLHLRTDVYTSLGVFIGLLLITLTGIEILDPIVAIGVAVLIVKAAYELTKEASKGLVDHRLPEIEEEKIKNVLSKHSNLFVGYHDFRTRKAGAERFVDFHIVMRWDKNLKEASQVCRKIEDEIESELRNTHVLIKLEACESETCPIMREKGFIKIEEMKDEDNG